MPEVHEPPTIAFAPHFEVRVLDERRILLLSEDRSFLLTGKLYVGRAPYLDGSRTREEIASVEYTYWTDTGKECTNTLKECTYPP